MSGIKLKSTYKSLYLVFSCTDDINYFVNFDMFYFRLPTPFSAVNTSVD